MNVNFERFSKPEEEIYISSDGEEYQLEFDEFDNDSEHDHTDSGGRWYQDCGNAARGTFLLELIEEVRQQKCNKIKRIQQDYDALPTHEEEFDSCNS